MEAEVRELEGLLDSSDIGGALAAVDRLRLKLEALQGPRSRLLSTDDVSEVSEAEWSDGRLSHDESEGSSSSCGEARRVVLRPVASLVAEAALGIGPMGAAETPAPSSTEPHPPAPFPPVQAPPRMMDPLLPGSRGLVVAQRDASSDFFGRRCFKVAGLSFADVVAGPGMMRPPPQGSTQEDHDEEEGRALALSPRPQQRGGAASSPPSAHREDFVSDVRAMKQIFHLASSRGMSKRVSLAVHRVGETLVLDGALDDLLGAADSDGVGDVDPETGEIIMLLPKRAFDLISPSKKKEIRVLDDDDDADDAAAGVSTKNVDHPPRTTPPSPSPSPPPSPSGATTSGKKSDGFLHYSTSSPSVALGGDGAAAEGQGGASFSLDVDGSANVPRVVRTSEAYERVVRWRFDGIETLLGSDTLVFSTGAGQDSSLHLCEVGQRLTEVAALDLWLENKMTALESCAICYHKEGHVAGCQIVKTDDLPAFGGATDHAMVDHCNVLHRARSILDFLQQRCTDDAGTYCITRAKGDDVIQLHRVDNKKPNSKAHGAPSPFDETVATLCLRIARRVDEAGDSERARKLLDRCLKLARAGSLRAAEAHERLAASYLEDPDARDVERRLLAGFGPGAATGAVTWCVAMPNAEAATADDAPLVLGAGADLATGDFVLALKHASAGLTILKRRFQRKASSSNVRLKKALRAHQNRSRLVLAASAYAKAQPGDTLRFLAASLERVSAVGVVDRLRFALVYALQAACVHERNVDAHRRALHDRRRNAPSSPLRPPRSSSASSHAATTTTARLSLDLRVDDDDDDGDDNGEMVVDPPLAGRSPSTGGDESEVEDEVDAKLPAFVGHMPVEVCADTEANLSRAIKALIAALRESVDGPSRDLAQAILRVVYTALGERYLAVERLTKGARHLAEGLELFRSLGDRAAESWVKLRLGDARFRLARRQQASADAKGPKLRAALETMRDALADLRRIAAAATTPTEEAQRQGGGDDNDDGKKNENHQHQGGGSTGQQRPSAVLRNIGCRTASIHDGILAAQSILARACLTFATTTAASSSPDNEETLETLLDATRYAAAASDDALICDAHYRIASTRARAINAAVSDDDTASKPSSKPVEVEDEEALLALVRDAHDQFTLALAASDRLATANAALDSLSIRVDAAGMLKRAAPAVPALSATLLRASLEVALGAAPALSAAAAARPSANLLLPIVVSAVVSLLHDVLKNLVKLHDPDRPGFATLKGAYARALRLSLSDGPAAATYLAQTREDLLDFLATEPKLTAASPPRGTTTTPTTTTTSRAALPL